MDIGTEQPPYVLEPVVDPVPTHADPERGEPTKPAEQPATVPAEVAA